MGKELRERVGQQRQQRSGQSSSTEVARQDDDTPLRTQVERMLPEFQKAMPRGVEATMLVRDAQTVLRGEPKLLRCTPESVLGGLMNIAQLGLRVGVLGHAWLLPMWSNKNSRHEAQLIIGYQGMVELAHRTGRIDSLVARVVHENDTFDVEYGLSDSLVHKPYRGPEGRGAATDYYAVVKFQGGGHAFWHMTRAEMEQHRDRFAMAKTRNGDIVGPWRDDFDGMGLKTCVRMLAKWMPKATEFANAIAVDESIRVDYTPDADPAHQSRQLEAGGRDEYVAAGDEDDAASFADLPEGQDGDEEGAPPGETSAGQYAKPGAEDGREDPWGT